MKIDLGCGKYKKIGFVGLDITDYSNIYSNKEFIQHNLTKPFPLEEGEVEEIYTSNFLEHLDTESFVFVMEEINRVTNSNGKVKIIVPHFTSAGAHRPYHKIYFDINALMQFTHPKENNTNYKIPLFKVKKRKIIFRKRLIYFWNYLIEKLINLDPHLQNLYESTFLKAIFPAYLIEFDLINLKPNKVFS